MAFPTIPTVAGGRVVSNVQANTTATRTFPAMSGLTGKASGDLLIAIVIAYQTSTGTNAAFSGWSDSFTEFHDSATSTTMAIGMAYKWSNGSESAAPTVTQAGTITGHAAMFILCIPGAHATTIPEAGSRASGTSAAADPAALDPAGWAAEDTLWIAVGGSGEVSTTGSYTGVASAPTSYTDFVATGISADAVGGVDGAVAFRQLNASSEDVGAFSVDTSNARNAVVVIAVRPPPAPATLDAGANTVTTSAPDVPSLVLTMPQTVNTVTISAPTQSELHEVTLAAGQNTVTVTAPDATGVFGLGGTTLDAGQNIVTISAPVQTELHAITLAAGQNTVTISAPTAIIHFPQTVEAGTQQVAITNDTALLHVGIQYRKNWITYSEEFNNVDWDKTNGTITANTTTAPDGTTTADTFTETVASGNHVLQKFSTPGLPNKEYFNYSIFVKPNGRTHVVLQLSDYGSSLYLIEAEFVLSGAGSCALTGDDTGPGTHYCTIETAANGFYRISIAGWLRDAGTQDVSIQMFLGESLGVYNYAGDGASGVYFWGAQLESTSSKSAYTKTVAAPVTNDVLTFGFNTITISAPDATGVFDAPGSSLAAGQNTVTVSAPTVPALALTMPQTVNTVAISAPVQSQLVETTLAAGQNTVTISAPDATGIFAAGGTDLAAGQNTVTISAPAQSQLVAITLAAGQNTVTVSASVQSQMVATTLEAGQNTVTVSAPAQSQLAAITLEAGQNTVTISAPAQSRLAAITLEAGQNTVTSSAPTVPSLVLTMPQTVNTVTIAAPNALLQQEGGSQTLEAEQNTVTISAPVVPAVHLLIPTTSNEISISAPAQSQLVQTFLAATANMVEVSAPTVPAVSLTMPVVVNTVLISAPIAGVTGGDTGTILTGGVNTVRVTNPVMTFVPEQLGFLKTTITANFSLTRNDEAPTTQLKPREAIFSDT